MQNQRRERVSQEVTLIELAAKRRVLVSASAVCVSYVTAKSFELDNLVTRIDDLSSRHSSHKKSLTSTFFFIHLSRSAVTIPIAILNYQLSFDGVSSATRTGENRKAN
jgi:hypothetical protein